MGAGRAEDFFAGARLAGAFLACADFFAGAFLPCAAFCAAPLVRPARGFAAPAVPWEPLPDVREAMGLRLPV